MGSELAKELGVDASTVSRDIQYLISQSHNYLNDLAKEDFFHLCIKPQKRELEMCLKNAGTFILLRVTKK